MVLYFSGTGNSKFVAERIANALNEKVCDISEFIKKKETPVFTEGGKYIFVAPSYMSAPAKAMVDFVEDSAFPTGIEAYFVVTCVASMGTTPKIAKRLSKKKGFKYMGSAQIQMPQNYIVFFKTQESAENLKVIKDAVSHIDELATKIQNGEKIKERWISLLEHVFTVSIGNLYYKYFMGTKKFMVKDDCISCGKCARVCPFGNISIVEGKPVWGDDCTHCMACINLCPKGAIEYGENTIGKPRYPGPFFTLQQDN